MDGWYIYGSLVEIVPEDRLRWQKRLELNPGGGRICYEVTQTPYRELTRKTIYFPDEPPWEAEKPIKDLRRDWPRLRDLMGEDENWQWETEFADCDRIGELGVYSVAIGNPTGLVVLPAGWRLQRHVLRFRGRAGVHAGGERSRKCWLPGFCGQRRVCYNVFTGTGEKRHVRGGGPMTEANDPMSYGVTTVARPSGRLGWHECYVTGLANTARALRQYSGFTQSQQTLKELFP